MPQPASLVTAIPAAQDNLVAALAKRPALRDVHIGVGWPAGGMKDRTLWVEEDVDDWVQEWSTSGDEGPAGIDEHFTLSASIFVKRSGAKFIPVRNDVVTILAELQAELRANFRLGGAVQLATISSNGGAGEWSGGVEQRARALRVTVPIWCEAYLTGET